MYSGTMLCLTTSDDILPNPYIEEEDNAEGPDLEDQLLQFRHNWQQELHNLRNNLNAGARSLVKPQDVEREATRLFLLGIDAEKSGAFYEAILFYKKAMHLVPDIESKIDFISTRGPRERQDSETSLDEHSLSEDTDEDLCSHFQELRVDEKTFCEPNNPQRMTHISSLPLEILIYIFRWVVSSDLDLRSLENLSQVCRGFHICARDQEMWRMICNRVWGRNTRSPRKYGGSWRTMFLEKPHPLFHGCYISRTGYVRQGEQGLDNFYRPFHIVYYYRLVRLFPDGTILMVCTPEEPSTMVTKMKDRKLRMPGVMNGYYKLTKAKVSAILKREPPPEMNYQRYKRRQAPAQSESESTFYVEFNLEMSGKRSHVKLAWCKYFNRVIYKSTGEEIVNNFDLTQKTFPPLIFSRVKSYTSHSDDILE